MSKKNIAKAGRLLLVDSGAYSSYGVTGFFVVLQDFDPLEKRDEFVAANPEQRAGYQFEGGEFLAFLIKQGLVLEIPYDNLFLSDYGDADEVRFTRSE